MNVGELAEALNRKAAAYRIGALQELRMRLRSLRRVPAPAIFDSRTIHEHYAFHVGGRKELQFNIGKEDRKCRPVIRHGVAFSLEPSQALPSIAPLVPKIARFNDYVRTHPEDFPGFSMWHYNCGERSPERPVGPIEDALVTHGVFIMLGRWVPKSQADVGEILADFDRLLPLYLYVESAGSLPEPLRVPEFRPGCPAFVLKTKATLKGRTVDVALRHKALQRVLYDCLCAESGPDRVAIEHELPWGGSVDAAVKSRGGLFFYELKASATAQACIREALGQLLEYAYWPVAERATELVVVGEPEAGADTLRFLRLLRKRFGLPLRYRRISLKQKKLGPRQ